MVSRGVVSGLLLAAVLMPPPVSGEAIATDEVFILSTYRSYNGASNRPRLRRPAGVDVGGQPGAPVLASADGDPSDTADPLSIADGCFAPATAYPRDPLVLTVPVGCRFWIRGR